MNLDSRGVCTNDLARRAHGHSHGRFARYDFNETDYWDHPGAHMSCPVQASAPGARMGDAREDTAVSRDRLPSEPFDAWIARIKQQDRDEDQRRLDAGEITAAELQRQNSIFTGATVRIISRPYLRKK